MAVPVTLTEQVGQQNSYHGPFRSSAGNTYTILIESSASTDAEIAAFKAVDPSTSWDSELDSGNRPQMGGSATDEVLSLSIFQKNDILYVATQNEAGDVYHAQFDMAVDAWVDLGSTDFDILVDGAPDGSAHACDICVLDGLAATAIIRIVYNGELEKVMGTDFEVIHHAYSTDGGASWGNNAIAVNDASTDVGDDTGPRIVTDGQDSWVVWQHTDTDNSETDLVAERSIDQAHGLQATVQVTALQTTPDLYPITHGVCFDRAGTKKVRFGYREVTTNDIEVLEFDVTEDPTSFATTNVSTTDVGETNGSVSACLAVDGSTVHINVQASDDDPHTANDQDTGTWTSYVLLESGVTVTTLSCNVFWRDGPKLGMILAYPTPTYHELPITYTLALLSLAEMAQQNLFSGPFEVL